MYFTIVPGKLALLNFKTIEDEEVAHPQREILVTFSTINKYIYLSSIGSILKFIMIYLHEILQKLLQSRK